MGGGGGLCCVLLMHAWRLQLLARFVLQAQGARLVLVQFVCCVHASVWVDSDAEWGADYLDRHSRTCSPEEQEAEPGGYLC